MKFAALFALLLHGATATNTCVTDFDADAGVDYYSNKGEHYRFSDLLVMSRPLYGLSRRHTPPNHLQHINCHDHQPL